MDATKTQAEKLALALKTIFEQEEKIKTMELEQKDQKAKFEKIKAQNQTLFKAMDCHQDLVEKLKSEIENLKLQKQSVAQDLAEEKERFKRSFIVSSRQIEDLKQEIENSNQEIEDLKIKHESQINQWKETATNLEAQLDKANSQIDDLKLKNQSFQDDWFKQESKIKNLKDGNLHKFENQKLKESLAASEKINQQLAIRNQALAEKFEDLKTALNRTNVLHLACQEGSKDQVKMFLEIGANTNIKSKNGNTPLHFATIKGHLEIVQLLLQNGSDVNTASCIVEKTPLHYAAEYGHIEIIKILLKYGARKDLKNCNNRTALQLAEICKKINVIPLLK